LDEETRTAKNRLRENARAAKAEAALNKSGKVKRKYITTKRGRFK